MKRPSGTVSGRVLWNAAPKEAPEGAQRGETARIVGDGAPVLDGSAQRVPWWSFGKLVLAVAALRLVERGVLVLDQPLHGRPFTLRQLLQHRAGLPDYGTAPGYRQDVAAGGKPWPVGRMLDAARADRLLFEPGHGWSYSNIGYLFVAEAVAAAAGADLSDALARNVFHPAGLRHARLATLPGDLAGVRMGDAGFFHPGWVYHGLVVGPVEEAALLLHRLLQGRLLRPDTLAAMLDGWPVPEHASALFPDPAYGLGVMLSAADPRRHPIGHAGQGPGSRIAVFGRDDRTVAVWMPSPGDPEAASIGFLS